MPSQATAWHHITGHTPESLLVKLNQVLMTPNHKFHSRSYVAVHTAEIGLNYVEMKKVLSFRFSFIRLLQKLIHVGVSCMVQNFELEVANPWKHSPSNNSMSIASQLQRAQYTKGTLLLR